MRYRPFGAEGQSISAVSLRLDPGPSASEHYRLMCTALEQGVNGFVFCAGDEAAAEAVRRAVAVAGRRVLLLFLRLELEGAGAERQARAALQGSAATYLDGLLLDRPGPGGLTPRLAAELAAVRGSGRVRRLALACEAGEAPEFLALLDFDILAIRYNMASGWPERNLLKKATERGMSVFGLGYALGEREGGPPAQTARGLLGLLRRPGALTPAAPRAYEFLSETPGWSAGQIGLAFALTEPALASVLVEGVDEPGLERLCATVEQELPAGVAAQIEIARFAAVARHSVAS